MYIVTVIVPDSPLPVAVSDASPFLSKAVKDAIRKARRVDPSVFEKGGAALTVDFSFPLADDNHEVEDDNQ